MPPKGKGKAGFKGVRLGPSGRFGVEFQHGGRRYWLGTFPTVDIAARAYEIAVWRLGLPRERLNFPEIESRQAEELAGPPVIIESSQIKPVTRIVVEKRDNIRESDEEAMARFAREHPEYVQYEMEFYWKRDLEKSKRNNDAEAGPSSQVKKEKDAGPSGVVDVDSDVESEGSDDIDWDNL